MFTKDLAAIYKSYLKSFYDYKLTTDDINNFKKIYPTLTSYYVLSTNSEYLHKVAKYLLLLEGRQTYNFLLSYDIIMSYFKEGGIQEHQDQSVESSAMDWFDTITPLVIIYHPIATPNNKLLENYLAYYVTCRNRESKTTILLTEKDFMDVKPLFTNTVKPVLNVVKRDKAI